MGWPCPPGLHYPQAQAALREWGEGPRAARRRGQKQSEGAQQGAACALGPPAGALHEGTTWLTASQQLLGEDSQNHMQRGKG